MVGAVTTEGFLLDAPDPPSAGVYSRDAKPRSGSSPPSSIFDSLRSLDLENMDAYLP
jgi:hypothetical protein